MAEMSVRMTLTLADTASPGLRAFMALIEQLGPKVTGLSNRLNTLEANLGKTGRAATGAAGNLGTYGAAADKADSSTSKLNQTLGVSIGVIQGFERAVRTATQMAMSLAAAWNSIGQATQNASAAMAAATANMAAANGQIGNLTTRVHSLTHSLQGLAEAWAATKLFQAGAASVNEASDFQQLEARVKALGRPDSENREIVERSRALSKQLGFASLNQALEARIGAISGMGHNDPEMIDATLPQAMKVASILRMRGDQTSVQDLVRNLYGMAEARGQTSDPQAMNQTFNLMQQNAAATGMKLTTKDVEAVARQLKYGSGAMLSDEGLINVLAFANQLKASGSGGGGSGGQGVTQAGTASTQVVKWALGGITNKETARLLTAMGIMDPSKIRDDSDTTKVNVGAKALVDSDKATRDPIGWLMGLAPIFLAFVRNNPDLFYPKGKDVNDPSATNEALTRLMVMLTGGQGGVNVGNLMAQAVLPGPSSRIQEEQKLTMGAKPTDAAFADVEATYRMSTEKFEASVKTLEVALGQRLLPALTQIIDLFSKFVRLLNDVAEANPTAATITTIALAIGAVALALSGLNRLFGIFAAASSIWAALQAPVAALGTSFTAAAAAASSAGGIISGVVAALSVLVRRIFPLAAAFLVGWDAGALISQLEVGGQTIHEWSVQFMAKMVGTFERGWARIKAFFGLITDAQRDTELAESQARQRAIEGWSGTGSLKEGDKVKGTKAIGRPANEPDPVIGGRALSTYPPADQAAIRKVYEATLKGIPMTAMGGHETPEERRRREIEQEAAGIQTGPYDPTAKKPKRVYNEEAGVARQEFRVQRAEMESDLRKLDARFKAVDLGINEYFDKKQSRILEGYADEIASLTAQLEALKNPKKGPVDQAAVDRVSADLDIRRTERESALDQNESGRTRELTDFDQHKADLQRQSEAVSGRRHQAELMRLDQLTAKRIKYFTVNNDQESVQLATETRSRAAAGIEFDQYYTKITELQNNYQAQEREVTDSVKAGTRTQIEAETDVYNLRRESAAQVQEYIEKLRQLAELSGDERLKKVVLDLATSTKAALTSLSPEILKIKDVMEGGFTDFFNGLQNKTKGFKGLVLDLISSIQKGLSNLASQALSQQLGKAIFGNLSGSGETSLLGGLGKVFSGGVGWVEKLFTGGGGVSAGPELLNSFASGIENVPRDMLAVLHKDERVLTAAQNTQVKQGTMSVDGGGLTVNNTFVLSEPASTRTQNQVAARAAMSIQAAKRNL